MRARSLLKISVPALAATVMVLTGAGLALAASSGGGSKPETPTCNEGWVFDQEKGICVREESEIILPDRNLSDYAYALAKEGRYREALDTLARMQNPNTAEALNYKGYATRKLGRIEEGIGYYLQSVTLDANYTQVREYLGEAYIQLGRLDLAREQLGEIGNRCGTSCENYQQLEHAIDAAL